MGPLFQNNGTNAQNIPHTNTVAALFVANLQLLFVISEANDQLSGFRWLGGTNGTKRF